MARIADPRFAKVHTAPQFRRQKRDKARVKIDPRFRKVLTDENFRAPRPKYDKYGRRATRDERGARDEITELYDDAEDEDPAARLAQLERMARGEDESEDSSEGSSESADDDEDDEGAAVAADDDDPVAAAATRAGLPPPPVTHETVEADAAVETRWLAVTEVEWSKVRALDLLVLLRSFVRPGGAVERVVVYRSDYGERMLEQDERFGPPRAIFRDAAAAAACCSTVMR